MLDIVFSIPIHHHLEVVLDQILNIRHYNPNCGIVFHFSKGFDYKSSLISREDFSKIISELGNVFINPNSVRTGFADIIQAHLSNFEYIRNIVDFEFFAIGASNEMFVKEGLYSTIRNTDCGFSKHFFSSPSDWKFGPQLFSDKKFSDYLSSKSISKMVFTTPEGQYYRKWLFDEVFKEIGSFFDYKEIKEVYPREEVFFSTIAFSLSNKGINIGNIYNYSAYHFAFLWDVNRHEIEKIKRKESQYFSVKRVDRNIGDNIRCYLRRKAGYDQIFCSLTNNQIALDQMSNIRVDWLSLKKYAVQLAKNWEKIPNYFTNRWKTN